MPGSPEVTRQLLYGLFTRVFVKYDYSALRIPGSVATHQSMIESLAYFLECQIDCILMWLRRFPYRYCKDGICLVRARENGWSVLHGDHPFGQGKCAPAFPGPSVEHRRSMKLDRIRIGGLKRAAIFSNSTDSQ